MYTGTAYFNIPFNSDNSKEVTFSPVTDLQKYYNDNAGGNKDVITHTSSSDSAITLVKG